MEIVFGAISCEVYFFLLTVEEHKKEGVGNPRLNGLGVLVVV